MKKIAIYGNCQAPALTRVLPLCAHFRSRFRQVREFEGVHAISLEEQRRFLEKFVPKLDVLVYQPIRHDYRAEESPIFGSEHVKSRLRPRAITISFPSLHFFGYQPRSQTLKSVSSEVDAFCRREFGQAGQQLVHHHQLMRSYLLNRDASQAVHYFDEGEAGDAARAIASAERSLNIMSAAEQEFNIDIPMSGFIFDNFVDRLLFHTPAHPGGDVLVTVARRILDILDMKVTHKEIEAMRRREPLGFVKYPLQRYVRNALNLSFPGPLRYRSRRDYMTKAEMVKAYYGLYDLFDAETWQSMSEKFPHLVGRKASVSPT